MNIATSASLLHILNIGSASSTVNLPGKIGIGITSPSSTLHVSGTLTFIDGNQGSGKFLGSDASGVATWQAITGADGWTDAGETWTYASADDPTFTFTISGDKTSKYSVGMRVKLTQTTAKYFLITAVSYSAPDTTITVYGGTDYDLANAAITSPYYSVVKAPQGFPMNPAKWTETASDANTRTQLSPTQNTWYNLNAAHQIVLPIGAWDVEWRATIYASTPGSVDVQGTLSTANNSESDAEMTAYIYAAGTPAYSTTGRRKTIVPSSKTTYYLNVSTAASGVGQIGIRGATPTGTTVIRAVSAYL